MYGDSNWLGKQRWREDRWAFLSRDKHREPVGNREKWWRPLPLLEARGEDWTSGDDSREKWRRPYPAACGDGETSTYGRKEPLYSPKPRRTGTEFNGVQGRSEFLYLPCPKTMSGNLPFQSKDTESIPKFEWSKKTIINDLCEYEHEYPPSQNRQRFEHPPSPEHQFSVVKLNWKKTIKK